ncbi:MAG TPA: ABC transporter ATP-binding protein [Bacteroidales bacterium]|nr:ABC transporter ATP-binding protein [Bacteroidales bacterium]
MNAAYIEYQSLYKVYKTGNHELTALSDINFRIEKGEFVIIKGRSGAGKSTLLSLTGGLIKPTSGKVIIDGKVINELRNSELSRMLGSKIGIIFQGFNLLPSYSIYENIEVALEPLGYAKSEMESMIMPIIEKFNLTDKLDLLPEQLSTGQQQKVAIVRTLVKQPEIILADEPTGSVDTEAAAEILEILSSACREGKATVILATHGNIELPGVSRMVVMNEGKLTDSDSI